MENNKGKLKCSGRVSSSCSTCGTCSFTLVTDPVIMNEERTVLRLQMEHETST